MEKSSSNSSLGNPFLFQSKSVTRNGGSHLSLNRKGKVKLRNALEGEATRRGLLTFLDRG